jgi:hypothetical protein
MFPITVNTGGPEIGCSGATGRRPQLLVKVITEFDLIDLRVMDDMLHFNFSVEWPSLFQAAYLLGIGAPDLAQLFCESSILKTPCSTSIEFVRVRLPICKTLTQLYRDSGLIPAIRLSELPLRLNCAPQTASCFHS